MEISIEQRNCAINDFAKTISNQDLRVILHHPSTSAAQTNCLENVLVMVETNGGRIQYGWTFNHRTSIQFGHYLFATHHAVWLNPQNVLVDITPFHSNPLHYPVIYNNNVLLLLDDSAKPIKKDQYVIPLPLKFFAFQKTLPLQNYVANLQGKEYEHYEKMYGISRRLLT